MSKKENYSNGYKSKYFFTNLGNHRKLDEEDVLTIRRMKDKLTAQEMADFYDVTIQAIHNVLKGKSWKDIKEEK